MQEQKNYSDPFTLVKVQIIILIRLNLHSKPHLSIITRGLSANVAVSVFLSHVSGFKFQLHSCVFVFVFFPAVDVEA